MPAAADPRAAASQPKLEPKVDMSQDSAVGYASPPECRTLAGQDVDCSLAGKVNGGTDQHVPCWQLLPAPVMTGMGTAKADVWPDTPMSATPAAVVVAVTVR